MKWRASFLIVFLLYPYSFALAQPHSSADANDRKILEHVKNTPGDTGRDIDSLVSYLELGTSSKKDIAKAFSYWIMQNISYDIYAFINNSFNTEGIKGTLRDKRGVCQDYAELFKAMCDRAGIKCYVVAGYAKAFGYKPGSSFDKANHAWNIICLDDNWYLMDLTWSSGYIDLVDDQWRYFLKPDPTQLFAEPEKFIGKHLPSDPKWQLLDRPVSMDAFLRFDSPADMLNTGSGYYNYRDSISLFDKLGKDEQELKSADDAYNFYPVAGDLAYHYYNMAVTYSNIATEAYNAAVDSYNAAILATKAAPNMPVGSYNQTGIANAINYYIRAIRLLSRISSYRDGSIDAPQLLATCNTGLDASKELLKTLK